MTTKKQGKVKPDAGTDTRNEIERTGWNITKTEIIAGAPNVEFTDIEDVDKNPRNTVEFVGSKTKEDMTTKERTKTTFILSTTFFLSNSSVEHYIHTRLAIKDSYIYQQMQLEQPNYFQWNYSKHYPGPRGFY